LFGLIENEFEPTNVTAIDVTATWHVFLIVSNELAASGTYPSSRHRARNEMDEKTMPLCGLASTSARTPQNCIESLRSGVHGAVGRIRR
jgi:hypothetical protein